jgi:hypothetical protein
MMSALNSLFFRSLTSKPTGFGYGFRHFPQPPGLNIQVFTLIVKVSGTVTRNSIFT